MNVEKSNSGDEDANIQRHKEYSETRQRHRRILQNLTLTTPFLSLITDRSM